MTAEKFYLSTDYAKFTIRVPNYVVLGFTPEPRGTREGYMFAEFPKSISKDMAMILNRYVEKAVYFVDEVTQAYIDCEEGIIYESR